MINEMLEAALSYARRGWAVLPLNYMLDSGICSCQDGAECKTPAKHPLGLLVPNGHHNATTDETTIRGWWWRHPRANVAKRVGEDEIVIDVESVEKTGIDGVAVFHELNGADKLGPLPPTFTVKTATGGLHLHFRRPASMMRKDVKKWLVEGAIELKSSGYVVMPPSVTGKGRYEVMRDV
ncbi:MAG: bifunctional DNA primase/polymerase [Euryarchaeota archaeon]